MLESDSVWHLLLPVTATTPAGSAVKRCLQPSSAIRVCAFPEGWRQEASIIIPVPRANQTELVLKRRRDEGAVIKPGSPSANQIEPAAKKGRDEGGVIKPCPAPAAGRSYCNNCGYGGRLENCHFCKELGCKKCNYWCSEKTGGCGLTVRASCNSFDGAVTEGQKGLWHCANCKPPEPLCN